MRKPESTTQKLWRYRGVLLVAAIPMLLILAVIALMPRASQFRQQPVIQVGPVAQQSGSKAAQSGFKYCVVFDAGSTGSRVHVFKFQEKDSGLQLLSDTFEQLKPGLSAYPDEPTKAADSLKPLMDVALTTVPQEQRASTPLLLRATAGLRLLPGNKSEAILNAVRAYFGQQPFLVDAGSAVTIMGGQDEGAYAWMTLNYLLGKLDGAATVAAIDLGGGSVQEAFAVSEADASAAPTGYINQLKAFGKVFNVYVHSYLGFGLMAARAKVMETSPKDAPSCFPKGYKADYTYASKAYSVPAPAADSTFTSCSHTVTIALASGTDCGAPKDQCSFSGAWRGKGPAGEKVYYVSSYFWDRAVDSGIIAEDGAISWKTSPKDFAVKAEVVCGKPVTEVTTAFGKVRGEQAPYFCLDLSFCYTVLTRGFKLEEADTITLVKQVEYNGQKIEAAWPLGAAINQLSS